MSKDERLARLAATLAGAPASGGVSVTSVDGMIDAKRAQDLFVDGMKTVMIEWHGRGMAEGRLRERERIATILNDKAALGRRDLAMSLALGTDESAEAVLAILKASPRDTIL